MSSAPSTHHGALAETLIRQSGYSITRLAAELGMHRSTLYRKFDKARWSPQLCQKVNAFFQGAFHVSLKDVDTPPLARSDQRDVLLQSYKNFVGLLADTATEEDLKTLHAHFCSFADKHRAKLEEQRPYMPWW